MQSSDHTLEGTSKSDQGWEDPCSRANSCPPLSLCLWLARSPHLKVVPQNQGECKPACASLPPFLPSTSGVSCRQGLQSWDCVRLCGHREEKVKVPAFKEITWPGGGVGGGQGKRATSQKRDKYFKSLG